MVIETCILEVFALFPIGYACYHIEKAPRWSQFLNFSDSKGK